jgi:hypothetical protein
MQVLEPALVQVLVAKLAVEALDVAVLHRAPRLDQDMADTVCLCSGHGFNATLRLTSEEETGAEHCQHDNQLLGGS